jgi:hypothetical protein
MIVVIYAPPGVTVIVFDAVGEKSRYSTAATKSQTANWPRAACYGAPFFRFESGHHLAA